MSTVSDSPQPRELAAELGNRSDAIEALVTLSNCGAARINQLVLIESRHDDSRLGEDLKWLAAMGLVRRESAMGTWDVPDPAAVYRLSTVGAALAGSLAALARACEAALPPSHR